VDDDATDRVGSALVLPPRFRRGVRRGTQQQQLRVSSAMLDVVATMFATVVDSTVTTDVIAWPAELL